MQKKRMVKKTITYFIGSLSTKFLTACLVVLYAFYIDASDLGKYEYIQTLVNIIVPISFFSIWDAILKFVLTEKDGENKRKIINTSALFSIVISFVMLLVFGIYYTFISNLQVNTIYILLTYILNGITWVWQNFAKTLEKNRIYVKSSIIGSAVHLITIVLLIVFTNMRIDALFIANILGIFTTFFVIEKDLQIFKNINKRDIDIQILKKMIKYSLPLVINVIPVWAITGFGKIIIQNILGPEANGIYSFAHKFTVIITFIGNILNMAITEEMFIIGKEDMDKDFSKIFQNLIEKFLSLTIIAIPFLIVFYKIISKTEYYMSKEYVPLLLLYALAMIMINNISTVFKVHEKAKDQSIATIVGASIAIIIMTGTINILGIMGVVLGQLCGILINLLLMLIFMKKYSKIKINYRKIIILMIIYSLVSTLMYKL